MLQDLSLHILDLIQNSIAAQADLIKVQVLEDREEDMLTLVICDNGAGMKPSILMKAADPFYTTRTTRRVGLGLAFLKASAESCGGDLLISSKVGKGTEIKARFMLSHIDRPPLGRMEDTMSALIACNPDKDFVYSHCTSKGELKLDTREVRKTIGEIPMDYPEVIEWIRSYIKEGLDEIDGGV